MKNDDITNTAADGPEQTTTVPGPGQEPLSAEQIEELKQQASKAAESWDRLLRTTADFDNFKKRVNREKQDAIKYANESLLEKLIPVLDNFEMALAATRSAESETARALQQGVDLVFQQFRQTLKDAGIEEIDAVDATFDPNFHEAISALENAEVPEGRVLQQIRKGYKLRDRLLRPASVVVAKAPATHTNP